MKVRPIIFSTEMVNAILDGRKTQTRRIVKPKPEFVNCDASGYYLFDKKEKRYLSCEYQDAVALCPYGQKGDYLYVRETFAKQWRRDSAGGTSTKFIYKADGTELQPLMKWKPSIHMPTVAARIWLRIDDIRLERITNISSEDAKSEGLNYSELFGEWGGVVKHPEVKDHYRWFQYPIPAFTNLWDSINEKTAPFETDPWVWVIDFYIKSTTGKPQSL